MRRNIVLTIQYDGTRFDGWQKQGNTDNTIQGKLESVLSRMANAQIELHGSGRTDAGVHAQSQIANFHTDCDLSCWDIMCYVNQYLPSDIAVTNVREAASRFHARLNAVKKHYRYRIRTSYVPDVFSRRYVWDLGKKLDIKAMKQAAVHLQGCHDFMSFCDNKRMKKSTTRTIEAIEFTQSSGELLLDFYGDGFLYHMVRIIVGTLVEVGLSQRSDGEIPDILDGKKRALAGSLAPAEGLCLMEVMYD